MATTSELVARYTDAWDAKDEATFRAMVADGCIRHDPGSTTTISLDDNVARFRATHERFPGLRFTSAAMWEHGDDTITVCFSMTSGDTELSAIEVFRFADGRIVEVWNAPAGTGRWG